MCFASLWIVGYCLCYALLCGRSSADLLPQHTDSVFLVSSVREFRVYLTTCSLTNNCASEHHVAEGAFDFFIVPDSAVRITHMTGELSLRHDDDPPQTRHSDMMHALCRAQVEAGGRAAW